jgi:ubiquitin carboxyl-terminal hydrolase 10
MALLTAPPAAPTVGPVSWMKISPRGLVNTGNMCFANTVLQILLYCAPFYRLFSELGKLQDRPKLAQTPLVDATVRFLKEFVPGKRERLEEDEEEEDPEAAFVPTYVYEALKEKKRFDHMRGGQQEDAEEFFGFYLDTLEEELLSLTNTSNTTKTTEKVEREEEDPEEGWMEVGKRNRSVVTRTVGYLYTTFDCVAVKLTSYLQIRGTESPITRIFGGKFRSALRIPGQKDSVTIEDWRSLRVDIQVSHCSLGQQSSIF